MSVDQYFRISERGSTFAREIRGGFATFFTMAYILVLNPIILGSAKDKFGGDAIADFIGAHRAYLERIQWPRTR